MIFGNNIINRTITMISLRITGFINNWLDTKMSIAFPLGILSGLVFPHYFDSYANPLLKKFIEPGDVAIDVTTNVVKEATKVNPVEISSKYGISIHGIIASAIAIPFFDDQFLSGILIGIGFSLIFILPYIGILLIGVGIVLEYHIAYKPINLQNLKDK